MDLINAYSRLGNVMEIRLTGNEGADNSTFLKMALLYQALDFEYIPVQPAIDDSLTKQKPRSCMTKLSGHRVKPVTALKNDISKSPKARHTV